MGLVGLAHACSHYFHLVLPPLFPILKNEFGVSDLSNKVTLIPDDNKMLHMEDLETKEYSDSINKYYNENYTDSKEDPFIIDSKKEFDKMNRIMEANELKDIIVDKLVGYGEDRRSINLNVF